MYRDEFSDNRYSKLIEVYYRFAYYMCCIPYRFMRNENGNYVIMQWIPQKVLCIIMSLLYTVYIIHRSIGRWKDLYEKSRTNGSDPILYIRIIESSAYINFALSVIYTQTFKGYTIVKYLNLLERYTRKHQIMKYKLISSRFLFVAAVLITTTAMLNSMIYINFVFNYAHVLESGYSTIFFEWTDKSKMSNLVVITGVIFEIMVNARDLYAEFFFLASILPLWLVSNEFQKVIQQETKVAKLKSKFNKGITAYSVKLYEEISVLSRSFSKCHGYPLMSYFLFYLVYNSIGLDRLFLQLTFGEKFYDMEFVTTLLLNYGLGAHFSFKMGYLKQFVTSSSISSRFTSNKINLISHWHVSNFAAIKASALPVTLNTLIQFVGHIMVVFLICVQSKLSYSREDEAIY